MTEEEKEILNAGVEVAKEVGKELVKQSYGDAFKPAMIQVGRALGTVLELGNTVLVPFEFINARVRVLRANYLYRLQEKMNHIPIDKIVGIIPEIAAPTLQRLEYTTNDTLINLFINLLTTASNIDTENIAHPSFVNIISNISPDEAKILAYMRSEGEPICTMHIRVTYNNKSYSDHELDTTIYEANNIIEAPNSMKVYISNLIGLGIIKKFGTPTSHHQYEKLEEILKEDMKKIGRTEQDVSHTTLVKGYYGLTEYGNLFLDCCLKND